MAYLIPQPTRFSTVPDYSAAAPVTGYNLGFLNSTQMYLSAGSARALTNTSFINYPKNQANVPSTILIDITTLGAGGCYPNLPQNMGLANDTVFGIYVISNSSGTSRPETFTSAVIATGNDFLPAGYDTFRRVGLCYIDSATKLLIKWSQTGNGNDRTYMIADAAVAIASGTSTTQASLDLSIGDGIVPPGGSLINVNLKMSGTSIPAFAGVGPTGLSATAEMPVTIYSQVVTQVSATNADVVAGINALGNSSIDYKVNAAGTTVRVAVASFTDSLGLSLF